MSYEITIRNGYGYEFGVLMSEELRDIHTGRVFPSFLFISMNFELSFDVRGVYIYNPGEE